MRDDLGTEVTIVRPPRRVVSLVPSVTEAVALAVPGALVGATDWCTEPPGLPVCRVRGTKNPDIAAIVGLHPDVVIAEMSENRRVDIDRLRAAGIPVWVLRIDDVLQAISSLDRLFREVLSLPQPPWISHARQVWDNPVGKRRCSVVVPIWKDPWMVVGSDTYAHDVLSRLGCENLGAQWGARYPTVSSHTLHRPVPDVVLLPDEPYSFSEEDASGFSPESRRVCVPGKSLFWFGPAMVKARSVLESLLYPEAAQL